MNRFVGNPFVWACCIALMLWSNLSFAELLATADRRTIAIGETLRLTLLGDAGEQPAEIDLTPLNRDWEILSRSSATNARFINGQKQVTRTLEMELAPLREGTLTIPSLTAGGRSTTPLAIRVNPEPVVAPGDELVLFERATFLVISNAVLRPHLDVHRFEKVSNIIKQFKLSCSKTASHFATMQVRNSRYCALIEGFTSTTYAMIIASDPSVQPASILINI